jgi:uncharacterized membrane protein YbaN (DUF454 family)
MFLMEYAAPYQTLMAHSAASCVLKSWMQGSSYHRLHKISHIYMLTVSVSVYGLNLAKIP